MLFPSHLELIILDCYIWIVNHFFELTSSLTENCVSIIKTNGTNDRKPSRKVPVIVVGVQLKLNFVHRF